MKRALYTIADEEFATLLERTHKSFKKADIRYMLVGGTAIQAHTANYLCQDGRTVLDLIRSPDFRIQDSFRATDDVDLTLSKGVDVTGKAPDNIHFAQQIFAVLEDIEGKYEDTPGMFESPTGEVVAIKLDRKGASRPIFSLGLNDEPHYDKAASFNLYKGPKDTADRLPEEVRDFEEKYYDQFMDNRSLIQVPFTSDKSISLWVKNAEDLISTKIVRGRPKDWGDCLTLAKHAEESGNPIDYGEVEKLLCGSDAALDNKPNLAFVERWQQFQSVKDSWNRTIHNNF